MTEAGAAIFRGLLSRHPALLSCRDGILSAGDILLAAFGGGGKVLACGNGGSAADADHFVAELMKGFLRPRPLPEELRSRFEATAGADGIFLAETLQGALPATALGSHRALASAFANDRAAEAGFAQEVLGYGRLGDVLVCFSTSGDSRSVVLAARTARALGLKIVGLTGAGGGVLANLCDDAIRVPETETYRVQELHLPVYHALAAAVEEEIFG